VKALPPDLQSGPFNHSGIHPSHLGGEFVIGAKTLAASQKTVELAVRVELTTLGLQNRSSAG
jgi:hypothetical protein